MNALYLVFAMVLASTQAQTLIKASEDNVLVQVYYESLCPYSIAFITKQLYPVYVQLKDYIELELIPWGHATEKIVDGKKSFTCQHGPNECYGNKVHSCVLDLLSIDKSLQYIACAEAGSSPTDDANFEACAENTGVSWTDIQECITSGEGDTLLSENGKKTAQVNPVGIPMIVIDGTYTDENETKALTDFRDLICSVLTDVC